MKKETNQKIIEELIEQAKHDRVVQEIILERNLLDKITKRLRNKDLLPAFLIQDLRDMIKQHESDLMEIRFIGKK